jgi:hypothetical protein
VITAKAAFMDKLKLTGQNLGQVFNFKCGRACLYHAVTVIIKTAKLKVENSAQTTFRLSPVSFCAPRCIELLTALLIVGNGSISIRFLFSLSIGVLVSSYF